MPDSAENQQENPFRNRRWHFLGIDSDQLIKLFFAGNATVAMVILALITAFLFKEGYHFFPQNYENLQLYRQTGVEFVDKLVSLQEDFSALTRYLNDIRKRELKALSDEGKDFATATASLSAFDQFSERLEEAGYPLQDLTLEIKNIATDIRVRYEVYRNQLQLNTNIEKSALPKTSNLPPPVEVNLAKEVEKVKEYLPKSLETLAELRRQVLELAQQLPVLTRPEQSQRIRRMAEFLAQYAAMIPKLEKELQAWNPAQPYPWHEQFTTFFLGRRWVTNSFLQDWYGILPLLTGSLMVSFIALVIAVPFGVVAAIYVNQLATPLEAKIIKPYIEFITALPSVVVGFFGVVVFGETVRLLSQQPFLSWVSFFPIQERLNAFTAGCLLALMAIPTIFTLAEDALNNVPRAFKEAALALGATRLQTTIQIILPAALSGIISAVLLGFGRVIGETMVVLLCAGNRITIPDFLTNGPGVIFQPVHTMTGIIAQEMGEVVRESLHYRALFLVGIVLFFTSLLVNYAAQRILRRYKLVYS